MLQSITITAEDILKQVKLSLKTAELIEEIITRKVIANAAKEVGIKLEVEELQEMADKYRKMYELLSEEDTWTWMRKNHLSLDDFEEFVYYQGLFTKLAVHLFVDKIEPYFYEHQLDYVGVVMYEVVLEDEDLAMELFYSIQEQEMSFYDVAHKYIEDNELRRKGGYRGVLYRKDLKPEISAAVFAVTPPKILKPIVTSKGVHLILVEEILQPELNDQLRFQIGSELFGEWVNNQGDLAEFIISLT
jgi:parvulin-like peptidyl-prolyl isomerase